MSIKLPIKVELIGARFILRRHEQITYKGCKIIPIKRV